MKPSALTHPVHILAGAVVALGAHARGAAEEPPAVAGQGLPLIIQNPGFTAPGLRSERARIVPIRSERVGGSDADAVWATGQPSPLRWVDQAPAATAAAMTVAWGPALTRDQATKAGALWVGDTAMGRRILQEAAQRLILRVPAAARGGLAKAVAGGDAGAGSTPSVRWKAVVIRAALGQPGALPSLGSVAADTRAEQLMALWAAALANIAAADRQTADALASRLLMVAAIPDEDQERWVPLFAEPGEADLARLLIAAPRDSGTTAAAMLAAAPANLWWVADDAGLRDVQTGHAVATVGLLNLSASPIKAVVAASGDQARGEPVVLRPLAGDRVPLALPPASGITVTAAGVARTLPVASRPVPAVPPGVLIGPFSRDWTADSFTAQAVTVERTIAGSITPGEGGAWTLYIECRAGGAAPPVLLGELGPVRVDDPAGESVRVWLGPVGAPAQCLEVRPDGQTRRVRPDTQITDAAVRTSRLPGGWCATVQIPPALVGDDGLLRVAIEHRSALGLRCAWPRPMFPWQQEPGRIVIDTGAWDRSISPGR